MKNNLFYFGLAVLILWPLFSQAQMDPQDKSIFDAYDVQNNLSKIVSIKNLGAAKCSECEVQPETELLCFDQGDVPALKKEDYTFFAIKNPKNIPGLNLENGAPEGITLMIGLPNDNKGSGLWALLAGNKKDGDDSGETSGLEVSVGKNFANGYRLRLQGKTTLFTIPAERLGSVDGIPPQHFTNESMIQLLVDNARQGNLFYYQAGVGWASLEHQKSKSLLLASGQQQIIHRLLGLNDYINVPTNDPTISSLSVDAFIGIQKNLINQNSTCRLKVYGEVGGHYSKLQDQYFSGKIGTAFFFQKPESNWAFKISGDFEKKWHKTGIQNQFGLGVEAQRKRTSVAVLFDQKSRDLQNHVKYNLRNYNNNKVDPIVTIQVQYVFGSWKRK